MNFKEKITEMVENVYDLARDGKYDVKVDLIPRKKGNIKSGVKVTSSRNGVQKTNSSLTETPEQTTLLSTPVFLFF